MSYQEVTGTVSQGAHPGSYNGQDAYNDMLIIEDGDMSRVRRLTPNECAALQGYPRDWCDIGEWIDDNGRVRKDSNAAKMQAIGNSIALPFWQWLLKRISAQYERKATLGSLFDGIGGFPFCWEKINGKGSAVWASEIEPFCIAVTKRHFPEETYDEVKQVSEKPQEPILLESNQDHATIRTDGISTTLAASMGNGGGYVPMITDNPTETSKGD